jgi:hypothetical protein
MISFWDAPAKQTVARPDESVRTGAGINPGEITSDFTLMEYALLPWGGQGRRRFKGLRLPAGSIILIESKHFDSHQGRILKHPQGRPQATSYRAKLSFANLNQPGSETKG